MTTVTAPLPFAPLQAGGLTLEQRLDRAWAELEAEYAAACPVCGEHMALTGEAGRCGGCRSELR